MLTKHLVKAIKNRKNIRTQDAEIDWDDIYTQDGPNYYEAITQVARRANNPRATREFIRAQLEPIFSAHQVPFDLKGFEKAYTEFNQAKMSKNIFDKKTKDGRHYNMAVIYELTNYYRLPSNKAQSLVEKYSQELQKKENNKTTPETAANMIIAQEGITGFEKIFVSRDSKTKDADPRGYKVTDQIIKGFMIYKSGKPNIFTAKNESGEQYEGTMEEIKKKIDAYWVKRDEDVMKQKVKDALMECMECGKKFNKNLTSSSSEVKCPKCGGYDVEVASGDSKTKDKKVCDDSIIVSPETGGYDISVFIKNKKVKTAWKSNKTLALQTARDLADFYRDDNGQSLNIVTKDARPKHPRWCIKDDKLFKLKSAVKKMKDAVNHMGERSFQTYEAWKRACKQMNPSVQFEGNKDICQAKPGIGEWDGNEGIIYTKDGIAKYSKTKDGIKYPHPRFRIKDDKLFILKNAVKKMK